MIIGLWGYEKIDPEGRPIYPLVTGQIERDKFVPCIIVGPFLRPQQDENSGWLGRLTCDQICSVQNRMNGYTNEEVQDILNKFINKKDDDDEC